MKRENLRKVEVFEYEYDEENNLFIEIPSYQGYFHEYIKNTHIPRAIIEQENGRLKEVYISDFRFLD